jgi:hypothetical protein
MQDQAALRPARKSPMPVLFALNDFWYLLPLVVSISLVYAASRHEALPEIAAHAARVATWILGFMGVIFAVLFLLSSSL